MREGKSPRLPPLPRWPKDCYSRASGPFPLSSHGSVTLLLVEDDVNQGVLYELTVF